MHFLSNGDYIFPFRFPTYWAEHVYVWSYQHGAANPDGIMRLPGRLIDLLVFAAFGNVAIGYFYLATCLLVACFGFYWFARVVLDVQRRGIALAGALFFVVNPIVLGNASKVGLVLAAGMLPIALTALHLTFERKRVGYLLLYVAALNISLLHPFTFSINLLASAVYLLYEARHHRSWVRDNLPKFAIVLVTAVLLNLYFILPLMSLGTVSKDALSDTVTSTPVDYTRLVDIANTGDIFTGLSLSKGVLKDYEFYSSTTWPLYFLGVFALYALLFGVYVRVEKRAKPRERRRFVWCLSIFLVLLVLSTASYLHADVLIKFLVGLPGGWMFRSPLKWQLYMPLVLCAALVIALKYVRPGKGLRLLYGALGVSGLLMNGYIGLQVYQRLLTPRTVNVFSQLAAADLEHKTLLWVNSSACMTLARDNPRAATELNQLFISKQVQVKHAGSADVDTIALDQFDYILGCADALDPHLLGTNYAFTQTARMAGGNYLLYRNTKPQPYGRAVTTVLALDQAEAVGGKYHFATATLQQPFAFITGQTQSKGSQPATGLQDLFDNLQPADIQADALRRSVKPLQPGGQQLFFTNAALSLRYTLTGNQLSLATTSKGTPVPHTPLAVNVPAGKTLDVTYTDPSFAYTNGIPNASLENGLWQRQVGDCNAYDQHAIISMRLDATMASQGKQSLTLSAKQHIACTGPKPIAVKSGEHYLLRLDYRSAGRYAGYAVSFDDTLSSTTSARLPATSDDWQTFSTTLTVPDGATQLQLMLYAYPDGAPGKTGSAWYDNLSLVRIPDVMGHTFMMSGQGSDAPAATPPRVTTIVRNPTENSLHITGARQPFYLVTKESYHQGWQLTPAGQGTLLSSHPTLGQHLRLNGMANGWYLDPAALCQQVPTACRQQADGSYDIRLQMSFAPQRWFYLGCLVSGGTALAVGVWLCIAWRRQRKERA